MSYRLNLLAVIFYAALAWCAHTKLDGAYEYIQKYHENENNETNRSGTSIDEELEKTLPPGEAEILSPNFLTNSKASLLTSTDFNLTRSQIYHSKGNPRITSTRNKRKTEIQSIRGPYKANEQTRYIELVLVVDNALYKHFESNISKVERYCKDIANIANGLFSQLNIFVALVGVITWTEHDEIEISTDKDKTLTNFLYYRRERINPLISNDNAQLLTKVSFDNGVLAGALKGTICTFEFSGAVNSVYSSSIKAMATSVVHSLGHNFGLEHDTINCKCPDEKCIMSPSISNILPNRWSSCSLEYLAASFEQGLDYCLQNKPKFLFKSPVCGNGFVEPGEECDCGLEEYCDNTCCNATLCLLNVNASCATGACCDYTTCKPKKPGMMCRSANGECDLPEYCTGQSEYCPSDTYKADALECQGGKAYCYHGYCRTRTDQCKLLWGNSGRPSVEECYKLNVKGSRHGNCGYNLLNRTYKKCEDPDILCGLLQCRHLNERLEYGIESVSILSHSFLSLNGSIHPCKTAIIDLGWNQQDPGLTPNGVQCGDSKMCVNQKCLSVEAVQSNGPVCETDCNGNGTCNNLGHCHCNEGYAPPFCEFPGSGGSEDSGPASDPEEVERRLATTNSTLKSVSSESREAIINQTSSEAESTTTYSETTIPAGSLETT